MGIGYDAVLLEVYVNLCGEVHLEGKLSVCENLIRWQLISFLPR